MTSDVERAKAQIIEFVLSPKEPDADLQHTKGKDISANRAIPATHSNKLKKGIPIHGWDDPDLSMLDDRRGELAPFPIETLSPPCQDWVARAARGAGVTIDHVAVPLLGIVSGLIGAARRIKPSRSWSEAMSLWVGIVGYSGSGKTPGIDATKRALTALLHNQKEKIAEMQRQHETRIEEAKAARKQWKQEVKLAVEAGVPAPLMPKNAVVPGPFVAPRLYVSDATIERLAVLLQAQPRGLLLIADELAGLFLNMGRYSGGSDAEFWLEAWNAKPYVVERMGRPPVVVDHLLVGMVGGWQPDKLVKSFEGADDGMYARVLFCWPAKPPYRPLSDEIDEADPDIVNALNRIIKLPAEMKEPNGKTVFVPRPIRIAAEAMTALENFRSHVDREAEAFDGREREWFAKAPAHAVRLAGTLAYLDWAMGPFEQAEPDLIDAKQVFAAITLVRDYFWPHSRAALRQIGLTRRHFMARQVLRWIIARGKTQVSREDIRRDALSQRLDADQTQEIIENLERAGWLRQLSVEPTSGAGRPRHRWEINKKLYECIAQIAQTAEKAAA